MPRGLLPVIYIAFVGLGLPDTILGAVWPAVRRDFALPLDAAGQAVLITTAGIALSSLTTARLLDRFGTGAVLAASSLLAATALALNALAPGWWFMLLAAVVAGLGGGAVDTALNGFVARHYGARHMNWLHGSWGIGATLGPLVAALAMGQGRSWRHAYGLLAAAELALTLLFIATLPRWRERQAPRPATTAAGADAPPSSRGARASVALFAVYGSLEASIGLWSASYLVATRAATPATAGAAVAFYWGGLTGGRLVLGLFATGGAELRIVRAGLWTVFPAALVVAIPQLPLGVAMVALALLGAALGPIYPTVMHDTPHRFGDTLGRRLVGYQVAACSVGIAVIPWLVGMVLRSTTMAVLPVVLAALAAGALLLERARRG
jgi:fucose permease